MAVPFKTGSARYGAAVLFALVGWALRELIDPLIGNAQYFVTAFPAVALAVWCGGIGPGLLSILICLAWANLFFIPRAGTILPPPGAMSEIFASMAFIFSSAVILAMGHGLHHARKRSLEAERELRATTDSLPVLISEIAADYTYRLNNRAYKDWFGTEPESLRGQKMTDILGEAAFAKLEPRLKKAFGGEAVTFTDYLPYTRNGGRWVRVTYSPLRFNHADVTRVVAMVEDITAQHQAEQNLAEREREYRALFELNATGLAETDIETGGFLRINGKFCQMLGYAEAELLELTFADITHPQDLPRDREVFRAALQSRAAQWESEKRFVRKDGSELWALVRGTILREASGRAVRTFASVIDLTDWKHIQTALQESEKRLRLALDAGRFGTWEWNLESGRVTWSDRLYEIHGMKGGEFGGTVEAFQKLVHPDDLARVGKSIEGSLKGDLPYQLEFRAVRPDGEIVWIWTAALVLASENRPARMVGITADITSRKRDEELLRSQAKHLEEMVQARTARLQEVIAELEGFSYTVAHDLRAPLRSMHGFATILRADYGSKLDPEAAELLGRIAASAARMDELIQDVLAYSRVTRDELALQPVDVGEILEELIYAHPELKGPFAEVTLMGPFPKVIGSRALLTQCLSNLLGNAVKFVGAGVTPKVLVSAEARGEQIRLIVRDNGIGIAPEHQQRVFNLFERLQQEYSGTGIGLAIVRRAVERMNGKVGLESQVGKGSCFWIELKSAGA